MLPEVLYKPKLGIQAMFLPGVSGKNADEETIFKIDQIFYKGIEYIQQFLEDIDADRDHTVLEYHRVQLDKEKCRMPDGVKVAVFVEDIEETGAWKASAIGYRAEIHVPQMTMDKLPENLHNFENLSEEGKVAYQLLLNHFLHEVLHLFGAFHSDSGIMSGVIQLFNQSDNGFRLINALDDITAKIVSETLLDEIFNKSPSVIMSFDRESNSLYFSSDIEIVLVVFLKQTRYTNKFFYCYTSEFHCTVPGELEWDAVFVQFLYGASIYYKQSSIYNNRVFDRFRGR